MEPFLKLLQGSELAEPCEQTSDIHGKDIKRLVQTSANGIIPTSPRTMPPPTMLPPPPKFTTSRPGIYGGNSIKNGLKSESVPGSFMVSFLLVSDFEPRL